MQLWNLVWLQPWICPEVTQRSCMRENVNASIQNSWFRSQIKGSNMQPVILWCFFLAKIKVRCIFKDFWKNLFVWVIVGVFTARLVFRRPCFSIFSLCCSLLLSITSLFLSYWSQHKTLIIRGDLSTLHLGAALAFVSHCCLQKSKKTMSGVNSLNTVKS